MIFPQKTSYKYNPNPAKPVAAKRKSRYIGELKIVE
jgi:hypothetical protein